MDQERRYREEEVREIFEAAAESHDTGGRAVVAHEGLTLPQLQEIGREVGLAPARIAEAASALDLRRRTPPRATHLAMPVSVGMTVPLPRAPTDREWSLLVAELRETFRARGEDRSTGSGRLWTNGNLHAYVEATEDGQRLRLGTTKGNASAINLAGIGGIALAVVLLLALVLTGQPINDPDVLLILTGLGGGALTYNAVTLPRWAGERERQMEHIASRALAITGERADAPDTARTAPGAGSSAPPGPRPPGAGSGS